MSFVNLKWKKRDTTNFIYIVYRDLKGLSLEALRNKKIRKGCLDTGYHYIVRTNGVIEEDRPSDAYAGWWFEHEEQSLAILVDAIDRPAVSAVKAIETLTAAYPDAEVKIINITDEEEI